MSKETLFEEIEIIVSGWYDEKLDIAGVQELSQELVEYVIEKFGDTP